MSAILFVLDLSTAHLTHADCMAMDETAYPVVMRSDCGFLVTTHHIAELETTIPTLRACIEHARGLGCDYLLFDSDGPVDPALPIHDW